ncbi:MAG: asparagine synthase [Thermoleophilaceae bacterium]|nr:asparagine synthase [Thermoleophilaceae bacterium]
MTESRRRGFKEKGSHATRRLRRRIARWAAPSVEAELRDTQRELRAARKRLGRTRARARRLSAELSEASYGLPPEVETTISRAREEHLTYLDAPNLRVLASIVLDMENRKLPGLIIEAGTARGGSAIVMAGAKSIQRPMKVYDAFGMIPPPTEHDGPDVHARYQRIVSGQAGGVGGETYYGYRDDLLQEVAASFGRLGLPAAEHNVELIKGLFEDTVDLDEPVAFAHLDGDWYESTMTCLTRIAPLLVPTGRIVLDDYFTWSGCRAAVDDYLSDRDGFRLERRTKLHIIRE